MKRGEACGAGIESARGEDWISRIDGAAERTARAAAGSARMSAPIAPSDASSSGSEDCEGEQEVELDGIRARRRAGRQIGDDLAVSLARALISSRARSMVASGEVDATRYA